MHKVIVERPRIHSSWKEFRNRKTALRLGPPRAAEALEAGEAYDSGSLRASSARHGKALNENLAPLRRYLEQQVGRPWRKVESEMRKVIDTRSAVRLHIWQHIEDFVATSVEMRGKVPVEIARWGGERPVDGLYVHPATGLLRRSKPQPERTRPAKPRLQVVRIADTAHFEKVDGLWFRFTTRVATPEERDRMMRQFPYLRQPWHVVIEKQQCNGKTIQRIERGDYGPCTGTRGIAIVRV